ncbi:MAG: choice-of-anchor Q domain-containing protein [Thermodesulfovibrionales bacterium]
MASVRVVKQNGFRRRLYLCVVALTLISVGIGIVSESQAATLIVTNSNDSGLGSLRDAVGKANSGDTIIFDPSVKGPINLTGLIPITDKDLTISGPESYSLQINGPPGTTGFSVSGISGKPRPRVFISDLSIENARTAGILCSSCDLTLTNVNCLNNSGGGIVVLDSSLTMANCNISGNSTLGGGGGLYIDLPSSVTCYDCTISGNTAFSGGGIWNEGVLNMFGGTVNGNSARHEGGGICAAQGSSTSIDGANITNNSVTTPTTSAGGGISNGGSLDKRSGIISGNTSAGDAGGIFVGPTTCSSTPGGSTIATLTLSDITISGNSAANNGGGINNFNGTVNMNNVTFSGNSAVVGGGIFHYTGIMTVTNGTVSGNTAGTIGGGVFNNNGSLSILNATISDNSSPNGGGVLNNKGSNTNPVTTLKNTIVANSPSGGNCLGPVTSQGHNISSDATCALNAPGDLNNTDPLLGPFENNGGYTQTYDLLPGSPAIDTGDSNGAPATDQRGVKRPVGAGVDIGSVEHAVMFVPTDRESHPYAQSIDPLLRPNPGDAMPFAVGDLTTGLLNFEAWFLPFTGNVDIYLAYASSADPSTIKNLKPDRTFQSFSINTVIQALSAGTPPPGAMPWKQNTTGPVGEALFRTLPISILPSGTYTVHILVTPPGSLMSYYHWITVFVIP